MFVVMVVLAVLDLLARRARDLPDGFDRACSSKDSDSSGDTDPDAARFSRSSRRRFNFLPVSGQNPYCDNLHTGHRIGRDRAGKTLTVVALGNAILDATTLCQV